MINCNSVKSWLNFMAKTAQTDDDFITIQNMIALLSQKSDFFESQTKAFNASIRYNIDKDLFVMRTLEDAEILKSKEAYVFDYMIRNMSQDNIVCLVLREDMERLELNRSTYYEIIKGLENKNYITKIPKKSIKNPTSRDINYYMVNPDKAAKRNMEGRAKLQGKYDLIRKKEGHKPAPKCNKETYHTITGKIEVEIGGNKSLFFDTNTVIGNGDNSKQNKKSL